ncbi:UNVERIFIED_CONTAM: hypothetical protein PYX00_004127 [Menopon gallinae]|uniref:Adipose-secreted signaling protein n=1 Tax=Menopon gallinae TaxID=328185 RepID=A0AAW2I3X3_9NEOP
MEKRRETTFKGQVHFGESENSRENSVLVQENTPGDIHIHLGFLSYRHMYEISLDIPKEYFLGHCLSDLVTAVEKSAPNVICKIISVAENNDESFHFLIEFYARKEKLLKEEIELKVDEESIKLLFIARVLGDGKGTPLLKNEIKCTGNEIDTISESSDWTGFD